MFIVGLLLGPGLGLLIGDFLSRSKTSAPWLSALLAALLLLFVLFVTVVSLELRLGLTAGIVLGLLLQATPLVVQPVEQ